MDLATVSGLAAVLVGIAAAYYSRGSFVTWRVEKSRSKFKTRRRDLKKSMPDLIGKALSEHSKDQAYPEIPLLTKRGWILSRPASLETCNVALLDSCSSTTRFIEARQKAACCWPLSPSGHHMSSYHEAISEYDKPSSWFDGPSYRLLYIQPTAESFSINVTKARYFDAIDTAEPLAFEAFIRTSEARKHSIRGQYRKWLGDPFSFDRRCAIPGISTLTIRRDARCPTFYLHYRDNVGSAQGTVHVIPAGEFQPSEDSSEAWNSELDLWLIIVREYAEEFLDAEDAVESWGAPIDYGNDPPYSILYRARAEGGITPFLLGVGLHPLTWKPEILTACVFEAECFDAIFGADQMTSSPSEGKWKLPYRRRNGEGVYPGWRFEEKKVQEFVDAPTTLPAGRACLSLAWTHRESMGLAL